MSPARGLRRILEDPRTPLWAGLVVAAVGFQLVYGVRLLSAAARFWSNPPGDMGQMLAGELAGLRAPWSLPILTPDTLLAPNRTSLVYTDSLPWLTAGLKALHLGPHLSLLGTGLLLAWLAQPAAAWMLLRASGVRRRAVLWAGVLLFLLFPAWLARQIGHIALSTQAFEIAALALAVQAIRRGGDRATTAGFFALGVGAVGIHAYHVPPVALMFVVALVSDVTQRRPGAARRLLVALPLFVLALVAAAWACGYFVGRGLSGGADVLGLYVMNMAGPVLPQASALAGMRWNGGWFTLTFDPSGYQAYEGFNYLGAGVLLLLVVAAGLRLARRAPPEPSAAGRLRRWGPLGAALLLLTLYAVGPRPWLGPVALGALPLPHGRWFEPFALFRCEGRFFWTVGYALLAGALAVLDRAELRPGARRAVLVAAVGLQALDMSAMLGGLHDRFSRPEPLLVPPALTGPAFRGRDLRIFPGFFCTRSPQVDDRIRQLALIAQRQDADTDNAETARPTEPTCPLPPPDLTADAQPGDRRITVVMRGDVLPTPVSNAFAGRRDCFSYGDGMWLCGRDLYGAPGLVSVLGSDLSTATTRDAVLDLPDLLRSGALVSGWSKPEPGGVWSDGSRAVLRLPNPALPPGRSLVVTVEAMSYAPPGRLAQRVRVSVGGAPLAEWRPDPGSYGEVRVTIPADRLPPGPVTLAFDLPDALSPNAVLPASHDPRRLGIGLRRATLAH